MSEAHTGTLGVLHVSQNALCNTHVTYFVTPLCINAFGASGFDKTLRLYAVFRQENHAKLFQYYNQCFVLKLECLDLDHVPLA